MSTRRLTQWAPRSRAPRPGQWNSGPARLGRFTSPNVPRGKKAPRKQPTPATPIFDQLFPPGTLPSGPSSSTSRDADVLAARDALTEEDWSREDAELRWRGEQEEEEGSAWRRREAVLVVRNGSKATLPSDFYRVAPRGEHLDGQGWSSMQATQARHPDTMDPMDKYILHFPTLESAKAYKAELERLVASPTTSESRMTLCPPDPSSLSIELVWGRNPFSRVPGSRVPHDILRRGLDARNLVLVKLEGSQLTLDEIGELVEADGKQRNLAWKLRNSWGKGGISVSLRGSVPRTELEINEAEDDVKDEGRDEGQDEAKDEWKDEGKNEVEDEEEDGGENDAEIAGEEGEWPSHKPRPEMFFTRFFLSFQTVHDARRFIRAWHRRPLNISENGQRACIINTSLVW